MAKVKKGDFIEMDFTGKLEEGLVFDTTVEKIAKENNIFQEQAKYKPVKLVIGEGHVVPGLDKALEDKETGKHSIKVSHEDAFGKKQSKLLKIIPMKHFKKQNINPFVGLEVNVDGMPGTVRSLSGGRSIVDFNHPLAGKDLSYDIDIKRILTDSKEKTESILDMMQMPYEKIKVEGKKATVEVKFELPEQVKTEVPKEIERLIGVKVSFKEPKKEEKKPNKKE